MIPLTPPLAAGCLTLSPSRDDAADRAMSKMGVYGSRIALPLFGHQIAQIRPLLVLPCYRRLWAHGPGGAEGS